MLPKPPRGTVGRGRAWVGLLSWKAMARSYPMEWSELDQGANIHLVCKMQIFDYDHDRHVMEVFPTKQQFYLSGLMDAGFDWYTVFDATLVSQFPVPTVSLNPSSCILGHKKVTWESLMSVIDMCCGFGGFSQGILPCGFQTSVAVDHNEKMVKLFFHCLKCAHGTW